MEKSDDDASIRSTIEPLRRSSLDTFQGESSDQPPAYSAVAASASSSYALVSRQSITDIPLGLPALDFAAYNPPGSTSTKDNTTLLVPFKKLVNPYEFLVTQASLPPRPLVRITGQHREIEVHSWGRSVYNQVQDFDITFDMMSCFIPTAGNSSLDNLAGGMPELRQRLEQFYGDNEINKHLILDRRITQWDTPFLAGCIRSLLEDLQYKGNVSITFPSTHSRVVIENSDHSPPRSSPQILEKASLRIYDLQAVWCPLGVSSNESDSAEQATAFVEKWWETWKMTVRQAILSRHQGLVGNEHWMDMAMGSVTVKADPGGPWGKDLR